MTISKDIQQPLYRCKEWELTTPPVPDWKKGSGATSDEWKKHKKIEFDPYEGRTGVDNFKLMTSAISPRPLGFLSTVSKDGVHNLAPFSYFTVVCADPPIFTIGISNSPSGLKDTPKNIVETGELTINIISEWLVEASNETSANAPSDIDEWELSGLSKLPSTKVKPPHVAESAFSVEAKLLYRHDFEPKSKEGKHSGTLFIVEGVNFHAREDLLNERKNNIDITRYKPVARLGGCIYTVTDTGFEIPKPLYSPQK